MNVKFLKILIQCFIFLLITIFVIKSYPMDNKKGSYNHLKNEKSPYLLQHADNPVDWYPWGDEAFKKAERENKPIFLSIGYSTCHWCHVMEHESFEDAEVAVLMNEVFVCIKVDREERPDIDDIYMTVCQMMTGSGGWPLTIIMTPDKKPFIAGTYFSKNSVHGRIGMIDLISRVKNYWNTRRDEINQSADEIFSFFKKSLNDNDSATLDEQVLDTVFQRISSSYDNQNGGFGKSPKFPVPHNLLFLMKYYELTGNKNAFLMVDNTLQKMWMGGIYDHIGFGFHRYSTDEKWLVPHFEKMLYDQALHIWAYTYAYKITGNEFYKNVVQEITAYVLRDMVSPEGGFYSAQDADSEGIEGKFYLFTIDEVNALFNDEDEKFITDVFNLNKNGNFSPEAAGEKNDENIFYLTKTYKEICLDYSLSEEDFYLQMNTIRQKLFDYRSKRVHPHTDDKILTDWNGLMIGALAYASIIFGDEQYKNTAEKAAEFVMKFLKNSSNELLHRYRAGSADINGMLDDYAFFIFGLLELYDATLNIDYIETAYNLQNKMIGLFGDKKNGGFYLSPVNRTDLPVRTKNIYDGAVPSGNSVAYYNLLRLYRATGEQSFKTEADGIEKYFAPQISKMPFGHTFFMIGKIYENAPDFHVVVVGDKADKGTKRIIDFLAQSNLPESSVLLKTEGSNTYGFFSDYLKDYLPVGNKPTAYVCIGQMCLPPANDIEQIKKNLAVK